MSELWKGCLICDSKCCTLDVAHPLFVTQDEMECIRKLCPPDKVESFNKSTPCNFLTGDGLCEIHVNKPVDCRLFPFDIMQVDGKFFWIVRQLNCLILQDGNRFEEYLQDFEEKLMPGFFSHLEAYADFRFDELASKYGLRILREVRINR